MWYDALTVVVIGLLAWRGAARGAIWQLAVLGSVGLCIIFARQITPHIEPHLPVGEPVRHWLAVGLVYLALSLVMFVLARYLRGWIEKIKFVEYDRHWGAILGGLKGILLMLVLTTVLVVLVPSTRDSVRPSYSGIATRATLEYLSPMFPKKVAIGLRNAFSDPPALQPPIDLGEPFELSL